MNTTRKGSAFELLVASQLEDAGWLVGARRHRKGGGDLIAYRPGHRPRIIECKDRKNVYEGFRRADREELKLTADTFEADALLATRAQGGGIRWTSPQDWPT